MVQVQPMGIVWPGTWAPDLAQLPWTLQVRCMEVNYLWQVSLKRESHRRDSNPGILEQGPCKLLRSHSALGCVAESSHRPTPGKGSRAARGPAGRHSPECSHPCSVGGGHQSVLFITMFFW